MFFSASQNNYAQSPHHYGRRVVSHLNSPTLGERGSSVERATSDEEVPGSIPGVAARSLLVGSVSV